MAAESKLTVVLSAKDELTPTLEKAKQAVGNLAQESTGWMSKLSADIDTLNRMVAGFSAVVVSTAATVTGSLTKAAIDFGKSSVNAFLDAEEAAAKLNKMLSNTGSSAESIGELNKFITSYSKQTVASSANMTALAKQLSTFDLSAEGIQQLLPSLVDMAIAEKGLNASMADYVQIGQMMGKAVQGDVSGLRRMGFVIENELVQKIKNARTEEERLGYINEILGRTYNDLADDMKNSFAGQLQIAKNSINELQEAFGSATVDNILQPLATKLGDVFKDIDWTGLFTNDGVNGMINGLTVMFQKAFEAIPTIIDSLSDYLSIFFESLGNALSRTNPADLMKSLVHLGGVLLDAMILLIKKSFEMLSEHSDEINQVLADALNGILKRLPDMLDVAGLDFLSPFFQPIIDFFDQHPEIATNLLDFAETMGKVATTIGAFNLLGGVVGTVFSGIGDAIGFLTSPLGLVLAALALLYTAWTEDWGGIQEKVQAVWEYMKPFFDWIGEQLAGIVAFWNDEIKPWLDEIWPLIVGVFDQIWASIQNFFQQNESELAILKDYWDIIWNAITSVIKIAWELIKGVIKVGWEFISGVIKAGLQILNGDWKGAWETIKETFSSVWKAIRQTLESVWNTIKDFWKKSLDEMLDIGKNLVEGLWNGINSMSGWIGEKISGFVNGITDKFKDLFGIASPSKVFAEMGKWNIAGLEQGMKEAVAGLDIPNIVADISGNFDNAMRAYTPQPAYASTNGNTYDNSRSSSVSLGGVTINNGMDVEAVAQYIGATVANAIY